jgi:hypothetical protein
VDVLACRDFNNLVGLKYFEEETLKEYGKGLKPYQSEKKYGKWQIFSEMDKKAIVPERLPENRISFPEAGIYYVYEWREVRESDMGRVLCMLTIWTTFADLSKVNIDVIGHQVI